MSQTHTACPISPPLRLPGRRGGGGGNTPQIQGLAVQRHRARGLGRLRRAVRGQREQVDGPDVPQRRLLRPAARGHGAERRHRRGRPRAAARHAQPQRSQQQLRRAVPARGAARGAQGFVPVEQPLHRGDSEGRFRRVEVPKEGLLERE